MQKTTNPNLMMILILSFLMGLNAQTILDTPVYSLTVAQRTWLLGQNEEAYRLYEAEASTAPQKEIPSFNAAYLAFLAGRLIEADRHLGQALQANPKYGPALWLKGIIEFERHNLKSGAAYLKQAIRYHEMPEIPGFTLGKKYHELGQYAEAAGYLDQAIRDDALFTYPYAYLGDVLIRSGNIKEAIKTLEKGLSRSYDTDILLKLAEAYRKNGQIADEKHCFQLFEYFFPYHSEIDHVRRRLAEIQTTSSKPMAFKPPPDSDASDRFFPASEDVLYDVKWGPLQIGEINTVIVRETEFRGYPAYLVIFSLDSNPALEFIAHLHSDYVSIIHRDSKQVMQHYIHARENDIIHEKLYDFDREKGRFICRVIREDGHIEYFEKTLPKHTIDGTSILFYARQIVKKQVDIRLMTIIDENFVVSEIFYPGQTQTITVAGRDEPTWWIYGENKYKGIVGFTGKFRGWFRQNRALLPVQADFEIWVGRISVTLAAPEQQGHPRYAR